MTQITATSMIIAQQTEITVTILIIALQGDIDHSYYHDLLRRVTKITATILICYTG